LFPEPPKEEKLVTPWHTPQEVEGAITSMSKVDLLRLRRYATLKIHQIARNTNQQYEPGDLLQESVTRLLESRRHWPSDVPFVRELAGVMRSVANEWGTTGGGLGEAIDSDARPIKSSEPGPDRIAEAKEELEQLLNTFAENSCERRILRYLAQGFTGPEIQGSLNISARTYQSAVTQIRRKLRLRKVERGQ